MKRIFQRKRLLLVLAVPLTFSAGFWWLTRPVIDPHLVGAWRGKMNPNGRMRFVLRADGSGIMGFRRNAGASEFEIPIGWKAVKGELTAWKHDSLATRFALIASNLTSSQAGWKFSSDNVLESIYRISADGRLLLDDGKQEFQPIPEP